MNKRNVLYSVLIVVSLLFVYACTTPGKESYNTGLKLSEHGQYKEAIMYLNQAIEKEPSNKQYQQALSDMKAKLISRFISSGNHPPSHRR